VPLGIHLNRIRVSDNLLRNGMIGRIAILSALLLATSGYLLHADRPEVTPICQPLAEFPAQLGSWQEQRADTFDDKIMEVLGVDDYIDRTYYSADQAAVGLYVGYYRSQRAGDTIHSPLNCLPGAGWNPVERRIISIPVESGNFIRINSIVVTNGLNKQLVLYWYQSHGRVVASEYMGKIYTVLDALRTNRTDAALVRVISPVVGSEAVRLAERQAVDFVRAMFPALIRFLPV
jgi:EpsI family protein